MSKDIFRTVDISATYDKDEQVQPEDPLERISIQLLGEKPNLCSTIGFHSALGETHYSHIRLDAQREAEAPLSWGYILAAAYDENGEMMLQARAVFRHITPDDKLAQLVCVGCNTGKEFIDLNQDLSFQIANQEIPTYEDSIESLERNLQEKRIENIYLSYEQIKEMIFELYKKQNKGMIVIDNIDSAENKFCITFANTKEREIVAWIHYIIRGVGAPIITTFSLCYSKNMIIPYQSEYIKDIISDVDRFNILSGIDRHGFSVKSLFRSLSAYLKRNDEEPDWVDDTYDPPLLTPEIE